MTIIICWFDHEFNFQYLYSMAIAFREIWQLINKVISFMNGFLFGLLCQFSPIHDKNGKTKKIPLVANVILLGVLIFILTILIRYYLQGMINPNSLS